MIYLLFDIRAYYPGHDSLKNLYNGKTKPESGDP